MRRDGANRLSRRAVLAIGTAALTTRVSVAQETTPPPGIPETIRIAVPSLPTLHDPAAQRSIAGRWLSTLSFDAPLRWDANGRVIDGIMRTTSDSPEALVQTFELRDDVCFPDGTPVQSKDVRYSIERLRNAGDHDPFGWRFANIRAISSPDERTLRITMIRSDVSLAATLAHPALGIVAAGKDGQTIVSGTGPFAPTSHGQLRRNAFFWEVGRPHIPSLELEAIMDDSQRSTAMALKRVHLMPNVPLLDVPMLQNEPSLYLVGGESNRVCYLTVNRDSQPLRDLRVRAVLARAIDRDNLVSVAAAGQGTATSLLFSGKPWSDLGNSELELLQPDAVRERLLQLGIPADVRLHLIADNNDATLATTAVVLQEQLANCGVALSVDLLEGDELANAIRFGDFDLLVDYSDPWRDPHELAHPLLHSEGVRNTGQYVRDEVDTLIETAVLRSDASGRRLRYGRVERWMLSDVPMIVLFRPHYFDAVSQLLVGYRQLPPVTSRGLMPVGAR